MWTAGESPHQLLILNSDRSGDLVLIVMETGIWKKTKPFWKYLEPME